MKKTYRLTIDYMFDIKEKIRASGDDQGEISQEKLDKLQQIIDTFLTNPEILKEYQKCRVYEGTCLPYSFSVEIGELIKVKKFDEIMESLVQKVPSEIESYYKSLFCETYPYMGSNDDFDNEFSLIYCHLTDVKVVNACFQEIEKESKIELKEGSENKILQGVIIEITEGKLRLVQ
ncbi:MAG: hypothetical protein JSV88_12765 [Candidatus Aminicenantes bacterium]|nr:MAG: hypothetical protein JSV88_12765 [Candidatus Aminicenantes bacterium]